MLSGCVPSWIALAISFPVVSWRSSLHNPLFDSSLVLLFRRLEASWWEWRVTKRDKVETITYFPVLPVIHYSCSLTKRWGMIPRLKALRRLESTRCCRRIPSADSARTQWTHKIALRDEELMAAEMAPWTKCTNHKGCVVHIVDALASTIRPQYIHHFSHHSCSTHISSHWISQEVHRTFRLSHIAICCASFRSPIILAAHKYRVYTSLEFSNSFQQHNYFTFFMLMMHVSAILDHNKQLAWVAIARK